MKGVYKCHTSAYLQKTSKKYCVSILKKEEPPKAYVMSISLPTVLLKNGLPTTEKNAKKKPELKVQSDMYEENRKLRQELEELKKENAFLKKAAAFFAREID